MHVKLVCEVGVGTVAAGVAKLKADVILISGHDGGTGASPLNSLKHAGTPWELGLAETQQTLLLNGLRDRVTVQVDGQLKTGRDVVVAALLGAEEFGFATAPLIVEGCVMMRVCHLDTCPVGIATQNPVLRERFTGKPEFVENFFLFLAEEVREYLAELGFRSHRRGDRARRAARRAPRRSTHWKAHGLDLAPVLHVPELPAGAARRGGPRAGPRPGAVAGQRADRAGRAGADATAAPVRVEVAVRNEHRSVGAMLGGEVTRRFGGAGLPDDTIEFALHGTAGQSFGAFLPRGVTLRLLGDANDYVGKGLSGGRLIVRPDAAAPFARRGRRAGAAGRGPDHRRQHHPVRGHRRRAVPARPGGGAVRGAQLRRDRGGRGRRRPRLRVHDRRHGGGARRDRAQLRRRHVRRHGVRARTWTGRWSTRSWSTWRRCGEQERSLLHDLVQRHFAETGSAVAEELLKRWPEAVAEFTAVVPARLPAGAGDHAGRRGRRPRRRRGGHERAGRARWPPAVPVPPRPRGCAAQEVARA